MCATDCGACSNCRETDVWIVSSGPASTLRPRPATETHAQPEAVPEVTPTVSALAATLRRDGGADHYERGQTDA